MGDDHGTQLPSSVILHVHTQNVSYIVHTGDLAQSAKNATTMRLSALKKSFPELDFKVVRGNTDDYHNENHSLPFTEFFEVGGERLFLHHGDKTKKWESEEGKKGDIETVNDPLFRKGRSATMSLEKIKEDDAHRRAGVVAFIEREHRTAMASGWVREGDYIISGHSHTEHYMLDKSAGVTYLTPDGMQNNSFRPSKSQASFVSWIEGGEGGVVERVKWDKEGRLKQPLEVVGRSFVSTFRRRG